jgi:hypothetical protein
MHERRLHVHTQDDAEPDQVDADALGCRREQRHDDKGDLEEIEEEGEEKHHQIDEDEKARDAARQRYEQFLDPTVPVDAIESKRKGARAEQNKYDEGRKLGRRLCCLPHEIESQAPLRDREQECAGRAHGAAFGGGREADEDRAEHEEDQHQRRDQRDHDADRQLHSLEGAEFLRKRRRGLREHHGDQDNVADVE